MKAIPRRTVLRGLGVCLGLPLLDAMLPGVTHSSYAADSQFTPIDRSAGVQPRAIFCYVPNGVNILEWVPKTTGRGCELSPTLQVLEVHRKNFTVLSGLGHPASKGGHSGADTWLTGADLTAVPGSDYSNSVSIDQVIAARHGTSTRFSSLQLSDMSGTGAAGHSHTLSFNASGTPIPAENSPRRLFERLFVPDTAADRAATLQRYAQKKSVLDSVLHDANRLRTTLNSSDQQKLDQYLQSVRETEDRVERLESWIDVPKPAVDSKMLQLASQPNNAHDRPMWIDVMMELCYLAFAHDATRVITFEWSREAGGYGGSGENHHEFSHHGGDEGMLKKLAAIDRFHLSKLARFLDLLKKTGDGDGQMLDHTMVLFGSGMNSGTGGEHSPKNLPLLIAGGNRFGFQHDQHLAFDADRHPPLSNLLLTIGLKMGLETDVFSDASGRLEL